MHERAQAIRNFFGGCLAKRRNVSELEVWKVEKDKQRETERNEFPLRSQLDSAKTTLITKVESEQKWKTRSSKFFADLTMQNHLFRTTED